MHGPSRRPLVCLLVVGGIVGVVLAIWVPRLSTLTEAERFARVWAISNWDVIPDRTPAPRATDGGRVCLAPDVADRVFTQVFDDLDDARRRPGGGTCAGGDVAVNVAAEASVPALAFIGPTLGVAVGRLVGADVGTQVLLARLASLAVYLALCALGVRWAPRGRWALVAVALLPSSLYAAVTSLSAHGFTIAASVLVVGSALRLADPALAIRTRRRLLEASVVCLLLAAAEPPFVVLVASYLIVWGGRAPRAERPPRWPALTPAAIAVVGAAAWHWSFRGLQACELLYRDPLDAGRSASQIARGPWRVIGAATDAVSRNSTTWIREAALVDVVPWALWIAAIVVGAFVVIGLVPDRVEESRRSELTTVQRAVLVVVGVGTGLAAIAWWLVACSPVGLEVGEPYPVWMVVPAVTPLLAGISWPGRGRVRLRMPWILVVVARFYAVWVAALLDTLR